MTDLPHANPNDPAPGFPGGAPVQEGGDDHAPRRKKNKVSLKVAALNITAFMDLTFNLLLFFVLTASFSIGEGVVPADLPVGGSGGASASPAAPPKNPLIISLRSFGTLDKVVIQIESTSAVPTDFEQLHDMLRSWRFDQAKNPSGIYQADNPIIIKPDRGVLWNHVVDAFNAVVRARYTNVSFAAVPTN